VGDLGTPDRALIVTGAPGSGKTSVAQALTSLLDNAGVEHGAIESEQLAWGSPWLADAQVHAQLAELLRMQRGFGRRLFVVVATTETEDDLASLIRAIGAPRVVVAALRVPGDVAAARVLAREPERWGGREALAEHARGLAGVIPALAGVDVVLDTDGRDEEEVAAELLDALAGRGIVSVDS
jgi:chloramphenicol 3-O-phosphotransferase